MVSRGTKVDSGDKRKGLREQPHEDVHPSSMRLPCESTGGHDCSKRNGCAVRMSGITVSSHCSLITHGPNAVTNSWCVDVTCVPSGREALLRKSPYAALSMAQATSAPEALAAAVAASMVTMAAFLAGVDDFACVPLTAVAFLGGAAPDPFE